MAKNLIIVESPTKANTLSKFLDSSYDVIATKGHIEDLPKSKFGVDIENHFSPEYQILKDKVKLLKEIQKKAKDVSNLYIATDPDREGEAIGWHILENLKLNKDTIVQRIAFHEITKKALLESLNNPTELNSNLIKSQQARRILDRIVGYKLSPLIWEKIRYGLSAGRVQSVALNLIVKRENEIKSFIPEEYWDISSIIDIDKISIKFLLSKLNNKKIKLSNEKDVDNVVNEIEKGDLKLKDIKISSLKKYPKPPYTTSTLQQDANLRLGFSSKKTMLLAQQMYEGVKIDNEQVGIITYMRTDSVSLSSDSISDIRILVNDKYSEKYLPSKPNLYKVKSKLAQEAHEAIRPSVVSRDPDSIKQYLTNDQYKVYKLIWERTVASQMNPAVYDNKKLILEVLYKENIYELYASFSSLNFDGFKKVYNIKEKDIEEIKFPFSSIDEIKKAVLNIVKINKDQHFTEPPARYNDASLIKKCELIGIGRPSTYSSIISTLLNRGYIIRKDRNFFPTDIGIVVNDFLEKYFSNIVDANFTSKMEDDLDKVASGNLDWEKVIKDFYFPFEKEIESNKDKINKNDITNLGESEEKCPDCGAPMFYKLGKYGKFLSCSRYPECKGMKAILSDEDKDIVNIEEKCPDCGGNLILKKGRFGDFYACSNYPDCKYTRSLKNNPKKVLEIKCPDCGEGNLVEIRNKRGQIFYGCSNYPKCKFTTNKLDDLS